MPHLSSSNSTRSSHLITKKDDELRFVFFSVVVDDALRCVLVVGKWSVLKCGTGTELKINKTHKSCSSCCICYMYDIWQSTPWNPQSQFACTHFVEHLRVVENIVLKHIILIRGVLF